MAAAATAVGTVAETAAETATGTETVVGMVVAMVVAPPVTVADMAPLEQAGPERDTGKVSDMDTRKADTGTGTGTEKHRSTA